MTRSRTSQDRSWDVFISHSKTDKATVDDLARKLSRYRPPRPPSPWWKFRWPKPLSVFVDDHQKSGVVLWQELEAALAVSSTLVVACSPEARRSEGVAREIDSFQRLRPNGNIVPILVGGLPNEVARKTGQD